MSGDFYKAFMEKHRGSREEINMRLRAYLPFVGPLSELDRGAQTIDLGCGRGEWLELMAEIGFKPYGVDVDEEMINGCLERNLSAEKGDAISFLTALPSESQLVVSSFHLVEHISFEQLQALVSEALRVLKPGGLLIMETPNPENIVVATRDFYLDPTHQRPMPPQLLSFLPEYYGFERVKTIRLQEPGDLTRSESLTLRNVLEGVSPDYAIIAQKAADRTLFEAVDGAFALEYGLTLETLAARYHDQLEAKAQQADTKAQQADTKAKQADAKAQQAETIAQQAVAKAQQAEQALNAIYTSRSWRVTSPLRNAGRATRCFRDRLQRLVFMVSTAQKRAQNSLVRRAKSVVFERPRLRWVLGRILNYFPSLKRRLDPLAFQAVSGSSGYCCSHSECNLSPRSAQILCDLKRALNRDN